jgi:hypothetical protein
VSFLACLAMSQVNDWLLGGFWGLPSARRQIRSWEDQTAEELKAIEEQHSWHEKYVPWRTNFDEAQDRARAKSGQEHSLLQGEFIDAPVEDLQTYLRACLVQGLSWGAICGLMSFVGMWVREAASRRGGAC